MTIYTPTVDAWRGNLREVDECIFYIRQGSTHLPMRLQMYRESLRRASECAEKLLGHGIDLYVHMRPER